MILEKQIQIAEALIKTGLPTKVYHSAKLLRNAEGVAYPYYRTGTEGHYVGPDDTHSMYAYIRQDGAAQTASQVNLGSCRKSYRVSVPVRIVIFKANFEGDEEYAVRKLLTAVIVDDVALRSYTVEPYILARTESPMGEFAFGLDTFYMAIDVSVTTIVSSDICEPEACVTYPNPIC